MNFYINSCKSATNHSALSTLRDCMRDSGEIKMSDINALHIDTEYTHFICLIEQKTDGKLKYRICE